MTKHQAVTGGALDLGDKVAIITGASQGIGLAALQALTSAGTKAVAVARTLVDLDKAIESCHPDMQGNVMAITADVRDEDEVRAAVGQVVSVHKRIDILVNSAGVSMRAPQHVEDISFDEWQRIIATNLHGTFLWCHEVLPIMKANNVGYILNILSTGAFRSLGGNSLYSASKFGARALTESLIEETKGTNVRVSSISPGPVNTNIWSHKTREVTQEERELMLQPSDIADILLFLVMRPPHVHIDNITVRPWNT